MTTTFEEAKLCPKCGKPGEDRQTKKTKNSRGKPCELHMIFCVTELCPWFNTNWVVQVNEDGSIPDAYSGVLHDGKQYPAISQETASKIEDNILREIEVSQKPGAEIRNPKG